MKSVWSSTGSGPGWAQHLVGVLPLQLGGSPQHHGDVHQRGDTGPVHQPAAGDRGVPEPQRAAHHARQLHPHRHLRHRQRLGHAAQPPPGAERRHRRRDRGGSFLGGGRGRPVGCPLHQPHHLRQPHLASAGAAGPHVEAGHARRGDPHRPCHRRSPRRRPDRLPGRPGPAAGRGGAGPANPGPGFWASTAAAGHTSPADVQLLRCLQTPLLLAQTLSTHLPRCAHGWRIDVSIYATHTQPCACITPYSSTRPPSTCRKLRESFKIKKAIQLTSRFHFYLIFYYVLQCYIM